MFNKARISESSSSSSKYQVFLSFRGPDTRQGFTDTLYEYLTDAGVRVFRDNNELRFGNETRVDLMQAIHDSQIYLPIFSKTYAKSKWCLQELAEMVEATRKSKGKEIIPIFYDVTANDVKCENGLYDTAMKVLWEDHETVHQWKEALVGVCKIRGWELHNEGHAEFCKSIVREISIKLRVKHKRVTDCLVGMDGQVKALMDLLNMESDGVKVIGIHGMGGIGKTTLAKVVFNQLSSSFDACSFILDVREKSDSRGLVHLQKQLLKDIGCNVEIDDEDDGINNIIAVSRKKKVIIVLDDVSQTKQIEKLAGASNWFGAGSRIIITTRDERNLKIKGQEIKPFEKEELDGVQALKLFSLQAFGKDIPPENYLPLSKEIVSFTGRLPLALEIIGSLLNGICGKEYWRNRIEELKIIPLEDVQKKLRISYDSLDSREKNIFLDIACLFDREEMTNPIYMWDARRFFPKSKVDVLVAMSLVKIKDGIFRMHDQVKDLGRDIVRAENLENPEERSRIWEENEALRVLKDLKKGRGKIKAIRLQHDDPFSVKVHTFTHEDLGGLENLRFLQLPKYAKIVGDLQDCLTNLRWFCLRNCNSVMKMANISTNNLVILELMGSDVSECWHGWNQLKGVDTLKVLDLTGSESLRKSPDLSGCKSLERLILRECINMIEIDPSIGNLKALKYLDCAGCYSLRGLPDEICSLEKLEQIIVASSNDSFNLPEAIGRLRSLKIFSMHMLRMSKLPHSIGDLKSLVELCLDNTKITELPNTIGGLVNLEKLSLSGCSLLASLPESVQNLKSLVELNLSRSGITSIPDCIVLARLQRLSLYKASTIPTSLGLMESLVKLELELAQVTELPDSIGSLKLLKVLNIERSRIRKLPSSIEKLKLLEQIKANGSELCDIPIEIGNLPCLRHLNFDRTRVRELPSGICHLPCLEHLYLDGCDELQQLPQLPSSLKDLRIISDSLKEPPDLSNCTNLRHVWLKGCQLECSDMDWLGRCSKLQDLSIRISKLARLPSEIFATWLELECPDLQHLPKVVIGLRSLTLRQLSKHCSNLIDLLDAAQTMESLTDLTIIGLRSIEMLTPSLKLQQLECFKIVASDELGDKDFELLLAGMKLLKVLFIYGCNSLESLCNLSKLVHLEELYIGRCKNLEEVEGLGESTSLKTLSISHCESLKRLTGLSKLEGLTIQLMDCAKLKRDKPLHIRSIS